MYSKKDNLILVQTTSPRHLEALLSGDTETLNTLLAFLVQLDRYAEIIAEGETDMDLRKIVH